MSLKISKIMVYLSLIVILLFLTLLLVVNLKEDFSSLELVGIRARPRSVKVENTPLAVSDGSTRKIASADTWLEPGQVYTVVDARGSGLFYTLWYSTTSESVWLRITMDDKEIWKNDTSIFSHGWAFNKRESGIGGVTSYGESTTDLGPVYGVYFKPSPAGLPFKKSLKIEFGNNSQSKQLIYYSQGFYSVSR